MFTKRSRKLSASLLGFVALASLAGQAIKQSWAQDKAVNRAQTASPMPAIANGVDKKPTVADFSKTVRIEPPTLDVVKNKSATPTLTSQEFINPHVQPGLVRWHATFAEACQAAKKSHKPVLLFHMMGKLDDLFC
jgi:hypothetical protein